MIESAVPLALIGIVVAGAAALVVIRRDSHRARYMIPGDLDDRLKLVGAQLAATGWVVRRVINHHINLDQVVILGNGHLEVYLVHERGVPLIEVRPVGWRSGASPSMWCRVLGIVVGQSGDVLATEAIALRSSLLGVASAVAGGMTQDDFIKAVSSSAGRHAE